MIASFLFESLSFSSSFKNQAVTLSLLGNEVQLIIQSFFKARKVTWWTYGVAVTRLTFFLMFLKNDDFILEMMWYWFFIIVIYWYYKETKVQHSMTFRNIPHGLAFNHMQITSRLRQRVDI